MAKTEFATDVGIAYMPHYLRQIQNNQEQHSRFFFIYIPVSLQFDEQGRSFLISWNNPDTGIS
jgi:hypothetical protein